MTDPTLTDAWARGARAGHAATADLRATTAPVPTSYTGRVCSILASPMLGRWHWRAGLGDVWEPNPDCPWPADVREWLWNKATRWPRGMEHPHHPITRAELGLAPLDPPKTTKRTS